MSNLKQTLQKDQIHAMKSGDKQTLEVVRYIVAYIKNQEIDKKAELSDEEVISVLRKEAKEIQESIDAFEKGGRTDLVQENKKKLEILSRYLPEELSDNNLKEHIQQIIDENKETYETTPKKLIGICIASLKSQADSARITRILKEEFGV